MPKDAALALLAGASKVLDDIAATAQRAAGGLTRVQLRCLLAVADNDGARLGDLAGTLDVNPSTALRSVDRLIDAKLVRRRENPDDRREVQLTLTKRGVAAVEASVAARRAAVGAILDRMTEPHRAELLATLERFLDAAGHRPTPLLGTPDPVEPS